MKYEESYHFETVVAERTYYSPDTHMGRHKDVFNKMSIVVNGSFSEKTDEHAITVDKPGLIIKPNSVFHENKFGKDGSTILTLSFIEQQTIPPFLGKWDYLLHPYLSVLAIKLWLKLKSIKNEKELQALLSQLQAEIEFLQKSKTQSNYKLVEAEKLLHDLKNTTLNVEKLAQELDFHRSYFSRAFKQYYHISPSSYSKYAQLLKAISLLLHSKDTIASVAYETGFADQSHLNRHLKREIGCTPLQLRELYKT